jgi:hypothetical protein
MNNNSPSLFTIIVGTLGAVAVVWAGYTFVFAPYRINVLKIAGLTSENTKKELDLNTLKGDQKRLGDKWNKFSLPPTVEMAAAEYGGMLKPLLGRAGLTVDDFKVTLPPENRTAASQKKAAQHQILTFSVRAKGTLTALTKAAEQLRQVPVMHRMKQIVIDRLDPKDKTGKLNIQMTIEAMIVANTDNHPSWRPSVDTAAKLKQLAPSERRFADIPLRDPFMGKVPPPPEPVKPPVKNEDEKPSGPDPRLFVRIDTILPNVQEASLYDRSRNVSIRLRAKAKSGYDVFRITDEDTGKSVMKAKVLRIDSRDVYFQVGDDVFAMHIGETLAEAMKAPMGHDEVERLELTALIDPEFAVETAGTGKFTGAGGSSKTGKNNTKKGSTKGPTSRRGL